MGTLRASSGERCSMGKRLLWAGLYIARLSLVLLKTLKSGITLPLKDLIIPPAKRLSTTFALAEHVAILLFLSNTQGIREPRSQVTLLIILYCPGPERNGGHTLCIRIMSSSAGTLNRIEAGWISSKRKNGVNLQAY